MREIRTGIALKKDELEEIEAEAKEMGISTAEFIRYAVFRFIAEDKMNSKANLGQEGVRNVK